jgi:hypothetical protein
MSLNFQEILKELEYRVEHGIIDLTKEEQVTKLMQILIENGVSNANELAQKTRVYYSYLQEIEEAKPKVDIDKVLNQTFVNPETKKNVKVASALGYDKKSQAYNIAKGMFQKAGFSEKDIDMVDTAKGDEEQPIKKGNVPQQQAPSGKKLGGMDFKTDTEKSNKKPTTPVPAKKEKKVKKINDSVRKQDNFNKDKSMAVGLNETESQKRLKANKVKRINNNPALSNKDLNLIFEGKTKFPKKYLKVLDRLLQNSPDGSTITMFTDKAGAGTLASTAGEIIGMIGLSIQDSKKRKYFFDKLRERVKQNGANGIVDESWVNASEAHCIAAERKLKRDFPNGYTILNTFWDVPNEADSIGVEGYKENKGFSTDVNMLVMDNKTKQTKWVEPSLKKTEKVNLLNGTTNRVRSIAVLASKKVSNAEKDAYESMTKELESMGEIKKGKTPEWARKEELTRKVSEIEKRVESEIPKEANPGMAFEKQTKLHQSVYSSPDSLKQSKKLLENWSSATPTQKVALAKSILSEMGQAAKPALVKEVVTTLSALAKNKESITELKSLGQIIGDTSSRGTQKASMFLLNLASATGKGDVLIKTKNAIDNNSNKHAKAVADYLLSSDENKTALLRSIREAFPVKSLLEGEENMLLGDNKKGKLPGTNIDQFVLKQVFGVNSAEEFQSGLKVFDSPPPPHISFMGKGKNAKPIEIATIKSRSDGKGYGGTWKLEMSLSDKFVDLCKQYDK